ncbi:MAG: MBL fold metallo-hydrolase [Bacteroidales bacterium]|nr:MBL fold metallo-hydrolase [Bacteroidales bacterium]
MFCIHTIVNQPITSNCFILYDNTIDNNCIIIDPGSKNVGTIVDFIQKTVLIPKYIILTHEHLDHCWGVNSLVERFYIPVVCSKLCSEAIQNEKRKCSVFYDNKEAFSIHCDTISIESLDFVLSFSDKKVYFFNTPGHTEASICCLVDKCLFTGDTLIKDMKTITKLPTGSAEKLKKSIELFSKMKGNGFTVYPGHEKKFELDKYDILKMIN